MGCEVNNQSELPSHSVATANIGRHKTAHKGAVMAKIEKTWDQDRLKRDRLQRVQQEMGRQGLGALWVSGGVEPSYILGTKVPSCQMFIPQSGDVIAFIRPRDQGYVRRLHSDVREPLVATVRSNSATDKSDLARKTAQGIVSLMKEYGVEHERLGVTNLDIDDVVALQDQEVTMTNAYAVIENSRAVKTQD